MRGELTKTSEDFLYLITCALHHLTPDRDRVCGMDFDALYKYAGRHTLRAITYDALELLGAFLADRQDGLASDASKAAVLEKWKEQRDKAFRKNLMIDSARIKLFSYMDKEGIWYMPLKGVILKELYPKQEMRQMADNDILFDAAYEEKVKDYFTENGYEVISYNKGNHDVYEKKPVYNFEMHTALFGEMHDKVWVDYYKDVASRLVREENSCRRLFTDEDFYIYFITHAFKHFDGNGTGIRSFVDCYVYQSNKTLDFSYIETELEKLGLLGFERVFRSVSVKIFGNRETLEDLNSEEYKMLCESMYAGTYGTMAQGVEKKLLKIQGDDGAIRKGTKLKYLFQRMFPPMSFYRDNYPFIYKTKILIPFFVIYRIARAALFRRKQVLHEAKIIQNAHCGESKKTS